jgi:hypothetical protein
MKQGKKRVVAYNLDEDVILAVEQFAEAQKRTRSSLVNYLLHQSLMAGQEPPEDRPDRTGEEE